MDKHFIILTKLFLILYFTGITCGVCYRLTYAETLENCNDNASLTTASVSVMLFDNQTSHVPSTSNNNADTQDNATVFQQPRLSEKYSDNRTDKTGAVPVEEQDFDFTEDDVFFDPFADNATDAAAQLETIPDPIQKYNRAMFVFNDKLYFWALKPVAIGYKFIVWPEAVRKSIKRFCHNVAMPKRFVNCLLQAKFKGAGVELTRFVTNTTIGIAGFFDPAKRFFHLRPYEEDTGQTLGVYGMGPGFYFVWPFFNASSGRDTLGMPFDILLDPLTYLPGLSQFRLINNTSLTLGEYEDLKAAALDPYIAIRNAYFQYRESAIKK